LPYLRAAIDRDLSDPRTKVIAENRVPGRRWSPSRKEVRQRYSAVLPPVDTGLWQPLKNPPCEIGILTAVTNLRTRRGAIGLLAAALSASGAVLAPAATDVRSELSKLQDVELRLVRLVVNGKEFVVPRGTTITLTFRKEGQIAGRSAVNNYAGVFTVTPTGEIRIQLTTATQLAGPPELMQLERAYFEALPRAAKIIIQPDRIILENEKTSLEFAPRRPR
jgi:heat shock protein HslJ